MRNGSKACGPALLLTLCGGALASPIETLVLPPASDPAPLISDGPNGSGVNRVVSVTPTAAGIVKSLKITGSITAINGATFGEEVAIQITPPGGAPITIAPFPGVILYTTLNLTDFAVTVPDVAANAGAWEVRFYETFDDAGEDAQWADGLTIVLDDAPVSVSTPTATDLGALPVGPSSVATVNIDPGTVTWFKFTTTGAEEASNTFLDIDTEFSGPQDTEIALYRTDGSLVDSDDDSGTGFLSVLTFGAGTRCPVSTGFPYDGFNGDLPAGEYYLAVGYYNCTFLAPFSATTNDTAGGTVQLNFNTGVQVPLPAPVPVANLGNIAGAPPFATTLTATVPVAGAAWYEFAAPAGITAAGVREFLDIDTEGSATPGVLVVYSGNGVFVAGDAGSGSGGNGQLTFGQGYRPPVGDGFPYDGAGGDLAPGNYFLAITSGNVTVADGFVLCTNGAGGDVTVNIRSGVQPVATAPTPAPTDLGTIDLSRRNINLAGEGLGALETKWFRFVLALDNTAADFYLDIDTEGSSLAPTNDTMIFLYDSDGAIVNGGPGFAFDDDGGSGFLSQLSFGNAIPRPAVGDGGAYNNQDGNIPPATYFLAVTGFPTNAYINEFAVYSASNNTGSFNLNLSTSAGAPPVLCLSDVNGDGTPDGTDFILFINSFGIGDATVDPVADVAGGGNPALPEGGPDGTIDGTDFIAFINAFGAGC